MPVPVPKPVDMAAKESWAMPVTLLPAKPEAFAPVPVRVPVPVSELVDMAAKESWVMSVRQSPADRVNHALRLLAAWILE